MNLNNDGTRPINWAIDVNLELWAEIYKLQQRVAALENKGKLLD